MSALPDIIVYHLTELRDELQNAVLTDSARMAATAQVQADVLRALIDPTPDQHRALDELISAFETIHYSVRRAGPTPSDQRIRTAFKHAYRTIDHAQAALVDAKPSVEASKRAL